MTNGNVHDYYSQAILSYLLHISVRTPPTLHSYFKRPVSANKCCSGKWVVKTARHMPYITSQSTLVPAVILRRVLNLNDSGRYIMSKKFLSFFIMWVPPLPIIKHPVVRQLELGPPIHPWDLQTSQIRPKRQVMPHLQQLVAATWVFDLCQPALPSRPLRNPALLMSAHLV